MNISPTTEVALLISTMQPVTTKALKESGDWQPRQPSNAIYQLKKNGLVETIEGEHWLTEKGREELEGMKQTPPKSITELAAEAVQNPVIGEAAKKIITAPPGDFRPAEPEPEPEPDPEPHQFAADYDLMDRMIETFTSCASDLTRIRDRLRRLDSAGGAA